MHQVHVCQLSIDQRYTFWVSKIVYVNKIDLRSAVKKFYVRGRGPVLAKIGWYTLKYPRNYASYCDRFSIEKEDTQERGSNLIKA